MLKELEYGYGVFLEDMKQNKPFGQYFDESDYEDEYSHNEIYEWMPKFIEKVRDYLHKNKSGEYIVTDGYCVFVMTIEEARKRNIWRYEDYMVD